MGMGKADVPLGWLHGTADLRGWVTISYPAGNPLILPQMNHLPESQILLQECGDHLVFQFPTYPEYVEAGLQIFCHFTFLGKSHSPFHQPELLPICWHHGPQVGTHLYFRGMC